MELVQRTLARLRSALEDLDPRTPLRVSVLQFAVAVLREFRAPTPAISYDGGIFVVLAQADPAAPYRAWRRAVEAQRMLPLDCQIVLELHHWEGLDHAEIAQVLSTHEYTVRVHLMQGKKGLRRILEERPFGCQRTLRRVTSGRGASPFPHAKPLRSRRARARRCVPAADG